MTLEEAKSLARVIGYSDGACFVCVENLVEKVNWLFPEFQFTLTSEKRTDREDWQDTDDEYNYGSSWLVVDVIKKVQVP